MRKETPNQRISLSQEKLTAHTFITGSTGSGKSNTIYTLLDKLCLSDGRDTRFLVVEPAKGEYKDVLGGYSGVSVYGTNPRKSDLLRLNPFSFPDDIQVFEHIDRLVEIFNACWPMYAAMPAVLKDAIEAAYVECGWSLAQSVCTPLRFPTFSTVMKKVKEVISKDYSADTKGDYVGALVTRLKSLTNGINGQIFCAEDEIANGKLFDENVIIDLSRVGSMALSPIGHKVYLWGLTLAVSGLSGKLSFLLAQYGCGGRTRTYDLRVMSPTSYQLLYSAIFVVPVTGLEPVRYCYRGILSPLRLPIPPHRQITSKS